ncbi:potassium voltage-gated channel subfamily KQT member 1-like isoform X4 [Ptychodera flava]|uniref:potassium voltage-gated channel subfamily KQT member 1-like isoform X4 n=1 Tax=Ptychodera flava TaxID=63121 RepID=UPI00396A9A11
MSQSTVGNMNRNRSRRGCVTEMKRLDGDSSEESADDSPKHSERRALRVEFHMADDWKDKGDESSDDPHSELRRKVKREFVKVHGRRQAGRLAAPRMSLLGKPLHYRPASRKALKYRKTQSKIYNFLERPSDWKAITYHVFVFLVIFGCLVLSVFATIPGYYDICNSVLFFLEVTVVIWFFIEFALRVWSAGCRSRYQGPEGRLRFIKRPLCILDMIVMVVSVIIIAIGTSNQTFAFSALRGLRFLQILRLMRVDRRGGTWKLLGSVVWAHRQELITTWYIGFLSLSVLSFLVYNAEMDTNKEDFKTFADAMWWGLVTLTTVGYGDKVPETWLGKLVAAVFAICGISFFALPAGILGSGFALKVQQQQRQKHFLRRRHPAAELIQCVWRCYAADPCSMSVATWKPHLRPVNSPTTYRTSVLLRPSNHRPSNHSQRTNPSIISRLSTKRKIGSPMVKRHNLQHDPLKKSHSHDLEVDGISKSSLSLHDGHGPLSRNQDSLYSTKTRDEGKLQDSIKELQEEPAQVYTAPEPVTSEWFVTQNIAALRRLLDDDETIGLTRLTEPHKNAIRAVRKIKYFVARRKFKEAFRPYDVKDVIEQYSAGAAEMQCRLKAIQSRLDEILGRQEGKNGYELYNTKIPMITRVVKVEKKVNMIDRKLDMLIELYRDERQEKMKQQQNESHGDQSGQESDKESPKETVVPMCRNRRLGRAKKLSRVKSEGYRAHESNSERAERTGPRVEFRKLSDSQPSIPSSLDLDNVQGVSNTLSQPSITMDGEQSMSVSNTNIKGVGRGQSIPDYENAIDDTRV